MTTELIDQLAALLILAFIIGRGISLLKDWYWLNVIEKDKPPDLRPQSEPQQNLLPAHPKRFYLPKNPTGARHEDYKEGIERAV